MRSFRPSRRACTRNRPSGTTRQLTFGSFETAFHPQRQAHATLKLATERSGSKGCTGAAPAAAGNASTATDANQAPTRLLIASWPPEGGELGDARLQVGIRGQAQDRDATGRHAAEITRLARN